MVRIIERRFQMPHAFEFPWMLCAVVPLMCCQRFSSFRRSVVHELVALTFWHPVGTFQLLRAAAGSRPLFTAVIGALNDLPKPPAGLRCIDPVRINRRTFQMINLPPREMRPANLPSFARAIRS